jgi:NTP pyrophosphatase (non-canonical NTP hydrolase)
MHSPDIFELNEIFQTDRPVMDRGNSDPYVVLSMLSGEMGELCDEFHLYSQGKSTKEKIGDEISDIMLFSCTLFKSLGLDGRTMVKEKVGRNCLKAPSYRLQVGELAEIYPLLRQEWKDLDGDEQFSAK